jgi:hypothetical protein
MILFTAAVAQAGTRGGHPIQGFQGVGDMVALFTALATGMLVAAALVRARA